ICHSLNNQFCDSSTDEAGAVHNGLSVLGEQLILEMEKLGIMIDISHASDETFYDVIKIAHTPVIASHSNARVICNHPRNLDDDMLRALAENGGVVQVCVLSDYVKEMPVNPTRENAFKALREKYHHFQGLSETEMEEARAAWHELDQQYPDTFATVANLVDHIDHIVNLIGIDHVGIGTDFDGGGGLEDCLDASQMIHITVELLRRGYSGPDIEKIWSGNFLRVFRQVEAYAKKLESMDE
ncbi:MAG: membrane dipeptidase, partial [Bacteroidales bacterium]|nr:membrane dipeptidase [Bacteroidales bacterium]